jgi:hypothetical protein
MGSGGCVNDGTEVGQRSVEGYATQTESQFTTDPIYSENRGAQLH